MSTPWLNESQTWTGWWWLPEAEGEKHAGFLRYDPAAGIELVLVGGFDAEIRRQVAPNAWAVMGEVREFPVLHGFASGKEITLLNCYPSATTSRRGAMSHLPEEQTIRADSALIGTHVSGEDSRVFETANLLFENLRIWAATSAMSCNLGWDNATNSLTGEGTLRVSRPQASAARIPGATIEIQHEVTLPSFKYNRAGSRGVVGHAPYLSISPDSPMSFRRICEVAGALQDLLAFAIGGAPALLWLELFLPRPFPDDEDSVVNRLTPVQVYRRWRGVGDPQGKAADGHELLFSLEDVPFDEVLHQWWEVRERFRAPCNIVLGERYGSGGFIESKIVTAIAAAESFHSTLVAKSGVSDNFVLKKRLEELVERLPKECQTRLVPDYKKWAREAKVLRNSIAHDATGGEDLDRGFVILRIARVVILLNLMKEMSLPSERLAHALDNNREFSNACRKGRDAYPLTEN